MEIEMEEETMIVGREKHLFPKLYYSVGKI